ncbi:MAG: gliding motility-associated C-terminal domain-containing protein [Bacteroidia bacterium]
MINNLVSQTITPSVINSGGGAYTVTINSQTYFYTDNIGEAIIGVGSNSGTMLTNGFIQPEVISVGPVNVYPLITDVSCMDKNDGSIKMIAENVPPGASITYTWYPASLCLTFDCAEIDSLSAGTFTVDVAVTPTAGSTYTNQYIATIKDQNGPCRLKVYNGINLSGNNKFLFLENIEEFKSNRVYIYSRWGNLLATIENYNNHDNYWPKEGNPPKSGTYFYVIDIEDNNSVLKGWVEVFE